MYTVYVLHVSQSLVKGARSSVSGGVDSYSASQLTDTLSQRLSVRPLTLGKVAASYLQVACCLCTTILDGAYCYTYMVALSSHLPTLGCLFAYL